MGVRHVYRRSDLFLVRLWSEEDADGSGKVEWHGKVQRVVDGESHQFREWQDLTDLLRAMLQTTDDGPQSAGTDGSDTGQAIREGNNSGERGTR